MTLRSGMSPKKIYLVEDDRDLACLLETRLKNLNYHVCGRAENAREAVAGIREHKPDLALLDIELNGTFDGLAVGDFLLSNTDIPFIYMTGHDELRVLDQARRTIPDGYLLKPFDDRQLNVAIEMARRHG